MKVSKSEGQSILDQHKKLIQRKKVSSSQYANVNSYKHFLVVPSANHSYIQWAFGLRSNNDMKQSKKFSASPPSTYYKSIQSQKMKHSSADINENVNISQFEHLALHRVGNHPSTGQLKFETTLRTNNESKNFYEKERKWCTIPKRDRNQIPMLIESKSLKKKVIQPQQMSPAVDGLTKYPKFTEKIIKDKNTNLYRHMIKGKINLPSISWQVNLRSY